MKNIINEMQNEKGGFFDLPKTTTCKHPSH